MTEEKKHEHHKHKEHHHEHKVHHHIEHKKSEGFIIKKADIWKISTALAVILLIFSIFTGGFGVNKSSVAGTISSGEAAQKAISYINANLLQPGMSAELKGVNEENGIYSIGISVGGQDYTSYVTQDGKMLFISGVDMTQKVESPAAAAQPKAEDIPKSDKPKVELFVMSYCPYGTQAEKGIIPAVKALGNNIEFKVRFVDYVMHGEKEVNENVRQYCIQKEQNNKFLDYLDCFLKDGESESCLTEAKIDTAKMDSCVEEADKEFEITSNLNDKSQTYPKFNVDAGLNTKYGVSGSPTLVINSMKVQSGRDSASYLSTICNSFNKSPGACDAELSSAQPSPGFGDSMSAGSATATQCG